jgi:hypothetical protein
VDQRERNRLETEERLYDQYWITDRGSDMRLKKGATRSSGSNTEEVT